MSRKVIASPDRPDPAVRAALTGAPGPSASAGEGVDLQRVVFDVCESEHGGCACRIRGSNLARPAGMFGAGYRGALCDHRYSVALSVLCAIVKAGGDAAAVATADKLAAALRPAPDAAGAGLAEVDRLIEDHGEDWWFVGHAQGTNQSEVEIERFREQRDASGNALMEGIRAREIVLATKLDDTRADLALANEELFFLRASAEDDRATIATLTADRDTARRERDDARAEGWQPIETAPRNGDKFWCPRPNGKEILLVERFDSVALHSGIPNAVIYGATGKWWAPAVWMPCDALASPSPSDDGRDPTAGAGSDGRA